MPINLLDFSNQKPADGSINILMSSSNIVGASLVDYVIKAVSIPFESDNAIDVEGALNQLNELTIFQSSSGQLTQGPSRLDFKDLNLKYNHRYYNLIENFYKKSGVPILLNTSFNENEPIVNRVEEAIDCFERTKMDILVLENYIVKR